MTAQPYDYKRHVTAMLFASLDRSSGEVVCRHYKRCRRIDFLNFMNNLVAAYPERVIHAILDNLSTHKPWRDMWLKRHKNLYLH